MQSILMPCFSKMLLYILHLCINLHSGLFCSDFLMSHMEDGFYLEGGGLQFFMCGYICNQAFEFVLCIEV
jgi:hypothetical protein